MLFMIVCLTKWHKFIRCHKKYSRKNEKARVGGKKKKLCEFQSGNNDEIPCPDEWHQI
jgi:hypothetical protein